MKLEPNRSVSKSKGFTLIELLVVIAIISILAAILFPVAGTVREQSRASDCLTKLHQLWISANVYKQDEGAFPPSLMGYAEVADNLGNSTGVYYTGANGTVPVNLTKVINGFLYPEQIKDSNIFKCPDNSNILKGPANVAQIAAVVTPALFPPRPANWPKYTSGPNVGNNREWIGEQLAGVCGTEPVTGLTYDCFTSGPLLGQKKYYYKLDSYDISPLIDPNSGKAVNGLFVKNYSPDWTGVTGKDDFTSQLKYKNPPDDKTLLTVCTYHHAVTGSGSVPAVSMSGTAKKLPIQQYIKFGPSAYAQ